MSASGASDGTESGETDSSDQLIGSAESLGNEYSVLGPVQDWLYLAWFIGVSNPDELMQLSKP